MASLAAPPHYPFVTRMLVQLYNGGRLPNVSAIYIEPEYGYAVRIVYINGDVRVTRANDVGLNAGAASDVVKDKAYTKYFLRQAGLETPPGAAFLTKWWSDQLGPRYRPNGVSVRTVESALDYVHRELAMPVYVKPVDGSKGLNVWMCTTDEEIERVLHLFEQERIRVALIEHQVSLPDFRLVVLDDELISVYQRVPLSITGDGTTSIRGLLEQLQSYYSASGRDTSIKLEDERITSRLKRLGLDFDAVPATAQVVQLHDISNLSAGGTAVDFTSSTAERWKALAVEVARLFGLRFCGVDLACRDITLDTGDYSVLEVNATPGLDHYGAVGADQEKLVQQLYANVLNRLP